MKTSVKILCVIIILWPLVAGVNDTEPCEFEKPKEDNAEKMISLFDGKTLQGWVPLSVEGQKVSDKDSSWSIKDEALYCSGKGKDYWIATQDKYDNFVLRLEYKLLSRGCNSGIFLRVLGPGHPAYLGFEVQILDDYGKDAHKHHTGSIYGVLTAMRNMSRKRGQWNQMEIICNESLVIVTVNDFKVIDTDFSQLTEPIGKFRFPYSKMPKTGYLGLQNHGGQLMFRNIRIKKIGQVSAVNKVK
ncbi:MAG: 3-keto-disaccharide hydrolase [Planctomycetota bacterium]|jgi:hypothetical protein